MFEWMENNEFTSAQTWEAKIFSFQHVYCVWRILQKGQKQHRDKFEVWGSQATSPTGYVLESPRGTELMSQCEPTCTDSMEGGGCRLEPRSGFVLAMYTSR